MTLSLDTAYRSFGGEVEASSTPTICRLPDSRRHQLWAIARQVSRNTGESPPGKVRRHCDRALRLVGNGTTAPVREIQTRRGDPLRPLPAGRSRTLPERRACRNRFQHCRARHPTANNYSEECIVRRIRWRRSDLGNRRHAFADRKNERCRSHACSRRPLSASLKAGRSLRSTGSCRGTSRPERPKLGAYKRPKESPDRFPEVVPILPVMVTLPTVQPGTRGVPA